MDPILTPFHPDLVAEANHRVANSLSLLGGLVRMQARAAGRINKSFTNAEVRLMLDGIAARVATLGQLYRLLAHLPADGAIPLNSHLREIAANLVNAFSTEQRPVLIQHSGAECLVFTRHVQSITLIVCEILTNAMKYAHPTGMPVKISVLCEASARGVLEVTVSDDGIGLPEGFDASKDGGLGFQIIRALALELGAKFEVYSDALGSTCRLSVPGVLVANVQTA